jgi:hypothetical protein
MRQIVKMNSVRSSNTPTAMKPSMLCSIRKFSLGFEPVVEKQDPLDETAQSALAKSCYNTINWKISENAKVIDAIQRMVAHRYSCII